MPLTTIESYPPTMQEFIAHWTTVNAGQPQPLILTSGTTLDNLSVLRELVIEKITAANQAVEAQGTARATYQALRATVYRHMEMFRRAAAYRLAGKTYASRVPRLPANSKDDADLFKAGDEILYVWGQANADASGGTPTPLLLQDNTTLVVFTTNLNQLRNLQAAQTNAEGAADTARATRDELLPQVKAILLDYRKAILALFARDSPTVQTLPAVSPAKTQKVGAVVLNVVYTPGADSATLQWSAAEPETTRLSVQKCAGPRWKADDAQTIGDLAPTERQFITPPGTLVPGGTYWFKVVAISPTGNEASSNAVKVVR
jgi:hypothetical protein